MLNNSQEKTGLQCKGRHRWYQNVSWRNLHINVLSRRGNHEKQLSQYICKCPNKILIRIVFKFKNTHTIRQLPYVDMYRWHSITSSIPTTANTNMINLVHSIFVEVCE